MQRVLRTRNECQRYKKIQKRENSISVRVLVSCRLSYAQCRGGHEWNMCTARGTSVSTNVVSVVAELSHCPLALWLIKIINRDVFH